MKINNIDLTTFSAELLDRQVSTSNIESITDWLDGSNTGYLLRQSYDFKTIKLTFLVREETEDAAYKKISALTEALKQSNIKFGDIDLVFPCLLTGASIPERIQNSVFKIEFLLKNDWGIGDDVVLEYPLTTARVQAIEITYKENWGSTVGYYTKCFTQEELMPTIAKEILYIDPTAINTVVADSSSWVEAFAKLGVDINIYKPENTLYGFIPLQTQYDKATAAQIISNLVSCDVLYNRYNVDGYPDIPTQLDYPSIVWTTGANNNYYFDLGVGQGWNIQDITIMAWGRFFQNITTGNGSLLGQLPVSGSGYTMGFTNPNAIVTINPSTPRNFKVFNVDGGSGHNIALVTLENISDLPLRQYGIKSSNEGIAAIKGYADVLFNGVTLDRIPIDSTVLDSNLCLMNGLNGIAKYCECSRVQVYYKGELVRDLIPIAGSVKNCFYNDYDVALYDVNTMEYIPWTKSDGTKGVSPLAYMPIPDGSTPEPPDPTSFHVTVDNGTGDGVYDTGDQVTINADAAGEGYVFNTWVVDYGTITLANPTSSTTTFVMPGENVKVTATYTQLPTTPTILYYKTSSGTDTLVANEVTMGQNAGDWAINSTTGDGPAVYGSFTAIYSVPNKPGAWTYISSTKYTKDAEGVDKWGRAWASFTVSTGKSATGQSITFTPTVGDPVTQNFVILSF